MIKPFALLSYYQFMARFYPFFLLRSNHLRSVMTSGNDPQRLQVHTISVPNRCLTQHFKKEMFVHHNWLFLLSWNISSYEYQFIQYQLFSISNPDHFAKQQCQHLLQSPSNVYHQKFLNSISPLKHIYFSHEEYVKQKLPMASLID